MTRSNQPHASVFERAESDMRRGDYGMARQRLLSYLSQKGYDPQLLARIGRIAYKMKDMQEAGRWWLLSDACGAEVEQTISSFVVNRNLSIGQIMEELPVWARLDGIDEYPQVVQHRLKRFESELPIKRGSEYDETCWTSGSVWRNALDTVLKIPVLLFILFLVASLGVGAVSIISWLFDLLLGGY